MRRAPTLVLAVVSVGCAGHIQTAPLDPTAWRNAKQPVNGVIAYEPQLVKVSYSFTTLTGEKGEYLGTSDTLALQADTTLKKCAQQPQKDEIQVLPNFDRGLVVSQTDGFLATNKLNVTLTSGMVSSVNAESAPKLTELIAAVVPGVTPLYTEQAVGLGKVPPCNAGPKITGLYTAHITEEGTRGTAGVSSVGEGVR